VCILVIQAVLKPWVAIIDMLYAGMVNAVTAFTERSENTGGINCVLSTKLYQKKKKKKKRRLTDVMRNI
jgi:hypothetical protein